MKYPDPKRVYAQGLGFLLGFSALGALLNYLNTLDMVSPVQDRLNGYMRYFGWL